jgi:hypothetical protein
VAVMFSGRRDVHLIKEMRSHKYLVEALSASFRNSYTTGTAALPEAGLEVEFQDCIRGSVLF